MTPDPYALGHGSPEFHVEHYDLDLSYKVATNRLAGSATLRVRTLVPLSVLMLDLGALTVEKVAVTGARLRKFAHAVGRLTLRLVDEVEADAVLEITVRYLGYPRPIDSPWGPVGWEELTDGALVASQPTGASSWFPCNDRPGDKATVTTRLTVDQPYVVHAPGRLVSRRNRASTTTWHFEETHPTAPYLATVQIGAYVELELASAPVRQRALVPASHRAQASARLSGHGAMMEHFVGLFGPYPFAEYTVVVTADALEIPLEAQGCAIFGVNHLSAVGDDERLVPHELAHQWFGNSLTVASWQHIWLNEGFACYAEWLWSPRAGGPSTDSLARSWHARLARLPQDLVLSDPGPAAIFDDRVYKRGALTLHALRTVLGEEVFWAVVRAWVARHRDGVVTTEDFREVVDGHADNAGGQQHAEQVRALLDSWLDAAPLPELPGLTDEGATRPAPRSVAVTPAAGRAERKTKGKKGSGTTAHSAG